MSHILPELDCPRQWWTRDGPNQLYHNCVSCVISGGQLIDSRSFSSDNYWRWKTVRGHYHRSPNRQLHCLSYPAPFHFPRTPPTSFSLYPPVSVQSHSGLPQSRCSLTVRGNRAESEPSRCSRLDPARPGSDRRSRLSEPRAAGTELGGAWAPARSPRGRPGSRPPATLRPLWCGRGQLGFRLVTVITRTIRHTGSTFRDFLVFSTCLVNPYGYNRLHAISYPYREDSGFRENDVTMVTKYVRKVNMTTPMMSQRRHPWRIGYHSLTTGCPLLPSSLRTVPSVMSGGK